MFKHLATGLILFAAACTAPADRVNLPQQSSDLSLRANVNSALVRTVSLPSYAAAEELATQSASGLITTNPSVLWADDPQRAMTLSLARQLGDILAVTVAPEPWPFIDLPDVAVDIRIAELLATSNGNLRLTGQFFVAGDRIAYPNITRSFDLSEPLPDTGLATIAAAQSRILLTLAEEIARSLGR